MKPNYLCIGAQKSGTYSLVHYMNQHPEIYMLSEEPHFFDMFYNQNKIKEYESKFKTSKKFVGEKTPSLCYLNYAMDRVHYHYPDIKLIFLLREPVKRAFSQYTMDCHKNKECISLKGFTASIKKDINIKLSDIKSNGPYTLQRGYYAEQIEYILTRFPKENLYIGVSEEILKNKLEEYNKIYKFIGTYDLNRLRDQDAHVSDYHIKLDSDTAGKIYEIYKPYNEKLYKLIGRKIDSWEEYYSSL